MKPKPPPHERRNKPRLPGGNAASSIVQLLIQHPASVADVLERDLAAGADPAEISGLLDAAEAILAIRGVDRRSHLVALRKRLQRHDA